MVIVLLAWPLVFENKLHMRVMTNAGLYAIMTFGVVIVLGQAGQLSFGHIAFYGIGAYMTAVLAVETAIPTPVCLLIGALAAGLVALIVGRPVLRLRYFYLALATIGLIQIFSDPGDGHSARSHRGDIGIAPVPKFELFGVEFSSALQKYYLVWVTAIIVLLFIARALKYRMGRAFRAIATSEIAASSLGMRTANWKLHGFVTSGVICGLAGGLFALTAGAVNPGAFLFVMAVLPIIMMLIGGGSVWGAVVGAVIIIYVKDWLPSQIPSIGSYSGVLYSVIMILLLMFFPAGLLLRADQRARISAMFRKESLSEPVECLVAADDGESTGQCTTSVGLPMAIAADAELVSTTERLEADAAAAHREHGRPTEAQLRTLRRSWRRRRCP